MDADLRRHELVKESGKKPSKNGKLTSAHEPHAICIINAADDHVLLLWRRQGYKKST